MTKNHFLIEHTAGTPWGGAFVREFDLMVAANEMASAETGLPLYNAAMNEALGARLAALDGGADLRRLPDIEVSLTGDAHTHHREIRDAIDAALAERPRGNWAVIKAGDRYDAYVSNGCGQVESEACEKFIYTRPTVAAFNDTTMYGHTLSMWAYRRRTQIRNRIEAHSFDTAGLQVGREVKDIEMNGKRFSRIAYAGVEKGYYSGGGDKYRVVGRRPGAKPTQYLVDAPVLRRFFGIPLAMPPEYDDVGHDGRVIAIVRPAKAA